MFFAKELRSALERYLNQRGITVLFLNNVKLFPFADLLFVSHETLPECSPDDLHHLQEYLTKSILINQYRNLVCTPFGIK